MFKANGGFTLVELIVVIAILGILSVVAVPQYSKYVEKAQTQVNEASVEESQRESIVASIATVAGITEAAG